MDIKAATKIAKDANSTAEQLTSLLGMYDKIDRLVAKHPNVTAEVLESLSRIEILAGADLSPSLIEWVIQHGNQSEKRMLWEHPSIPTEMFINLSPNDSAGWGDEIQRLRAEAAKARFCMALELDVKASTNPASRTVCLVQPDSRHRRVHPVLRRIQDWTDNKAEAGSGKS